MTYHDAMLAALEASGRSARKVSLDALGHESAVRSLKRKLDLRGSTIQAICRALDLEFYVGPPRSNAESVNAADISQIAPLFLPDLERHTQGLVQLVVAAGGNPIPQELHDQLLEAALAEAEAVKASGTRRVQIPFYPDVHQAAGSGEPLPLNEAHDTPVTLELRELAPWARPHVDRLVCAPVKGDSMAPTIRDGDWAATDPGRRVPLDGQIFTLWTAEGLVIKRLRGVAGHWHLVSDNPKYKPQPVDEEDYNIHGQVAWWGPPRLAEPDADGG